MAGEWPTAALAFLFAAVAASGLVVDLIKWLVGRTRPRLVAEGVPYGFEPLRLAADYQSFPSGHACTLVALALVAGFLAPRLMVPLLALAGVLALGRIAAGAHYLSDLLGGAAVAVAVACALRERFAARGWVFVAEGGRLRPARPGRMLGRWLRRRLRRTVGRRARPGGNARPPAVGDGPAPGRGDRPAPPVR
ncbi:MAG: phosphatase PAP2 family protein [Rhodospirillaceae bacterium]|nr:phosphatase PAP2 family protein [Rhodospirillaceae bacterium]